jgi:hypothetical protein
MMTDKIHARAHYSASAERDHAWVLGITFITGAMLGATLALGWGLL